MIRQTKLAFYFVKNVNTTFRVLYSLPLGDDVLEEIVDKARDWALMHGAAMRSKDNFSKDLLQLAPFVLLPSPFPRKEFEKAVSIQPILNELMHKVAHSHDFLVASLKSTIEVDEFTRKLFEIYETVNREGVSQTFQLGLFRSDYFADSAANFGIKQVEFNTIASSFGGIATNISQYNRYVLRELGHDDKVKNLPTNGALQGLCEALAEAWAIYADPRAVVMIVVENVSYNICDQRFHEFEIRELHPEIRVIRKTLTEIGEQGKLGPMKELIIKDDVVSVVYFRSGYEPGQYPSQLEWEARLLVERSRAIKSPSIQYHLAGTKKVQQALARPGAVEKFLTELHQVEVVREIFTGLYSLDFDKFGEEAIQLALANPDKFVLKPQREGGGNNVYGEKVREELLAMKDSKERTAWILMERINPPIQTCYIVRPGQDGLPPLSDLVSELGIFGVIIGDKDNIIVNKQVGHMLRTKLSSADEGGVAAGAGALDSPYLIDAVVGC